MLCIDMVMFMVTGNDTNALYVEDNFFSDRSDMSLKQGQFVLHAGSQCMCISVKLAC